MQKIVVCGQSRLTITVLERLLRSQLALSIAVPAESEASLPMATLTVIAGMTTNELLKATAKTWATTDVLVITDYGEIDVEGWQRSMLAQLRKVIGVAMAAGFAGKILMVTHDDVVMTYFAQRFSGLAKSTVVGLGTIGVTGCFERTLADQLHVPRSRVTAYALGTAVTPVLMWSRAYVGTTPVLSLLQPTDGQPDPLLATATAACTAYGQADGALLWPPLVERVIAAFAGEALLAPLVTIDETVAATPVLVNETGVKRLASLHGAEAEEAALVTIQTQTNATIAAIEKGAGDE
ncbi:lactate dehydrogenase [Lacticaseibacillus sp. GG6-2]